MSPDGAQRPRMTEGERKRYILNWIRPGITIEQQIREVLPLVAGELGNSYGDESHIRAARYTSDVRWLLGEVDRLKEMIDALAQEAEIYRNGNDRLRAELQRIKDAVPMFPVPKDPVLYIQELLNELCPLKVHTRQMAEQLASYRVTTEVLLGVEIPESEGPLEFALCLMRAVQDLRTEANQ